MNVDGLKEEDGKEEVKGVDRRIGVRIARQG